MHLSRAIFILLLKLKSYSAIKTYIEAKGKKRKGRALKAPFKM